MLKLKVKPTEVSLSLSPITSSVVLELKATEAFLLVLAKIFMVEVLVSDIEASWSVSLIASKTDVETRSTDVSLSLSPIASSVEAEVNEAVK